jgi:hypothetical protein
MGILAGALPYLAGGAILGGTALQWAANNKASHANEREAIFNSYAETDLANQTEVSTQLQVYALRRRKDLDLSTGFAAAAAGYGGGIHGSAQDILLDTAVQEELEIMTARYQGYLEKRSHETAAAAGMRAAGTIGGTRPLQNLGIGLGGIADTGLALYKSVGPKDPSLKPTLRTTGS